MTRLHVVAPTRAPGRAVLPDFVTDVRPRAVEPEHRAVGRAAELGGLDGVLVPFDPAGHDPLVLAAAVLRDTRHVQVAAGFHPAIATPVYAAKLSASLQRYTGGRLAWRLAVDLAPDVARAHGDFLDGPARYARADEFLTIAKGVWGEGPYTFEGEHFQVLDGGLPGSRVPRPFPRVYLSGTSPEALALSARHADAHLIGPDDDPGLVPDGVDAALRLRAGGHDETALADEILRRAGEGIAEFFVEPAATPDRDAAPATTYWLAQRVLPLLRKETEGVG